MKIIYTNLRNSEEEVLLAEAIEIKINRYLDGGSIERLEERLTNTIEIVAKLASRVNLTADQVKDILGYGFEVEE